MKGGRAVPGAAPRPGRRSRDLRVAVMSGRGPAAGHRTTTAERPADEDALRGRRP